MNWWALSSLFFLSMVKFLFTPFSGPILGLTFLETYISCVSGAIFASTIFYFSANYFMRRSWEKKLRKQNERIAKGLPVKKKKSFTRTNKLIVRIKRSIGIIGVSFWAPLFLSIPIGSIVVAKFYGAHNKAYPLVVLGICINGVITTGLAYTMYG